MGSRPVAPSGRIMTEIAGVILAGGLSSRMGAEKALLDFGGAPLIARVVARFGPQVDPLAINANGDPARFASFGPPVIPDARTDRPGPLAGVAAGLAFARARGRGWLATVPCDAPFAPRDFVARLFAATRGSAVALARSARGAEPLFGLWPVEALEAVEAALCAGEFSVHRVAAGIGRVDVALDDGGGPDWALNLNDPGEFGRALAALRSGDGVTR